MSAHHKWADPIPFHDDRGQHWKTERVCDRCGMVKVTRHEPTSFPPHWIEWWRGLEKVGTGKTPVCVGELELVEADA